MMKTISRHGTSQIATALLAALFVTVSAVTAYGDRPVHTFKQHSMEREKPTKVTPGKKPGAPPSDAVVLFGGKDLSAWEAVDGSEAGWKVEDGDMVIVPGSGSIRTKKKFGDCHLHIEWATDPSPDPDQHYPGNSGVYFGSLYEIQILSPTPNIYADGMAGAIYGQYPPLVDANREAGEWQTYEIIYRRPRFDEDGKLTQPATMTVFHNGVLVQDCEALTGPTAHKRRPPYKPHGKLPIMLQDHGCELRFRNIWLRPLDESKR